MKYCCVFLIGLMIIGCSDGSGTGLSRDGRVASQEVDGEPPEGTEYVLAQIFNPKVVTALDKRPCCDQYNAAPIGSFRFTGLRAEMTLDGTGQYHRNTAIKYPSETFHFDRYAQNLEIIRSGYPKLIDAYCGVSFSTSASFTASPYENPAYIFGDVGAFAEGAAKSAGPSCVGPTITMCNSPISVSQGAQTSCTASYNPGSGGVEQARWLVDGGFHSEASQTSPAQFQGYIAAGTHTLTLQIINKAGYSQTGVVQVNVAGETEAPPPDSGGGGSGSGAEGEWQPYQGSTWCWFEKINGVWVNTGKCWEM